MIALRQPALVCAVLIAALSGSVLPAAEEVTYLKTSGGVRFGLQGTKPARPAATVIMLGGAVEDTLGNDVYNKLGRLLGEQGWLSVGIDLPCHGQELRAGEGNGIAGWAGRLKQGEDVMAELVARSNQVLDFLIEQGYTDPERIAVAGTSRGGFSALHLMAANPRIRCGVAFAPVVDLSILSEFKGFSEHELTRSLDLEKHAAALAGRPIWICIGNNDERVSTDACIAFSRRMTAESVRQQKPPDVELHVMTSRGHTIHPTAHDEAAAWTLRQFGP